MQKEFLLADINSSRTLAVKISQILQASDVITFRGELGVGKTTIIQFIIKSLVGDEVEVTSPTFNLLHLYQASNFLVYHYDLYRIKNINEIYELAIENAFTDGVALIEWPEIVNNILPQNRIDIFINFNELSEERILKMEFHGDMRNRFKDI